MAKLRFDPTVCAAILLILLMATMAEASPTERGNQAAIPESIFMIPDRQHNPCPKDQRLVNGRCRHVYT